MKKILLVLLILLFTTACYDYREIDDLALITGITLEKKDDEFMVTYEVLDTSASSEEKTPKSNMISANGKSIVTSFENIALNLSKIPYFYHLKIFIIDDTIANEHLKDLIDFLSRNAGIRNEFYLLLAKDIKPSEILKSNNDNKVISDYIETLIKNNENFYSVSTISPFENFFEDIVNNKYSANLSTITLKDEEIKLSGLAFFDNYKLTTTFDDKDSALFNVINNSKPNFLVTKDYENGFISSNIFKNNKKITFKDNKAVLKLSLEGNIMENTTDKDLIKPNTLKDINKDFLLLLKEKITTLVNKFNEENIDPLKIKDTYYKKYRKKLDKIDYEIEVEFKNNKRGLTFTIK